jgi:methylated-DNA-protein-cysteine methyltransferase related protein
MKRLSAPQSEIKMTAFTQDVIRLVRQIPRGKVATYGQIAELAGKPGAARGVGWILNSCAETHKLPWQRVLNSQGQISLHPKSAEFKEQRRLLKKEGVEFLTSKALDLSVYQWKPKKPSKPRKLSKLQPRMFS